MRHEAETCVERDEQEYDERVRQGDEKGRHKVVDVCAFAGRYRAYGLDGVAPECVYAEDEKQHRAYYLQPVYLPGQEIGYETHAVAGGQRVEYVAHGCTHAGDETVPTAFVERPLYAKHAYRTQRCGYYHAYYESFHQYVYDCLQHCCKDNEISFTGHLIGAFSVCFRDRLGLGPGCAPSRPMIGSVFAEDGVHPGRCSIRPFLTLSCGGVDAAQTVGLAQKRKSRTRRDFYAVIIMQVRLSLSVRRTGS